MDSEQRTRIEYEHQFFNFSSDAFIDGYKELLKNVISECLKNVKGSLQKKLVPAASNPQAVEDALEEMKDSLNSNYERGLDYALSKHENKIRECFEIPDNVLLPEDSIVATVKGVDTDKLDKEIEDLKKELKKIAFLTESAKREEQTIKPTLALLEDTAKIKTYPLPKV